MKKYVIFTACVALIILMGGIVMGSENHPEYEKVKETIHNSIGWAKDKDTAKLYGAVANDSSLFFFQPDDASTVFGFEAFKQMTESLFLKPEFQVIGFETKNLLIDFSESGEVAWYSCYLDDFNTWDGKPANWENVRWTGVLEKVDSRWRIKQMHFSHSLEAMKARYEKQSE